MQHHAGQHHAGQHRLSMTKHSNLARTMAHVRKPATATSRLGRTQQSLGTEDRARGGGDTGGLSWHEKLLMRRARNAAASRNRRRLKKLGVLTRSKRRTLETQARTTENEAAAAALQASPAVAEPATKPPGVTGSAGGTERSRGVARRRPGPRRVLAEADTDSEAPYVVVINTQGRPRGDGHAAKPRSADQRRQRHHNSPGGSTTDDRMSHRRKTLLSRKESRVDPTGRGDSHKRDTLVRESSTIATKTRSRTSSEILTKQQYSRDIATTRDSRAKRRSTPSVDREHKIVAPKKESRLSRVDHSLPSGSGSAQKTTPGGSPLEGSRKRSKGQHPGISCYGFLCLIMPLPCYCQLKCSVKLSPVFVCSALWYIMSFLA